MKSSSAKRPSGWSFADEPGITVRRAVIGGVRTRFVTAGKGSDGPPIVFLHGITGQAESFAPNLGALAERFRVVALDWPAHGGTDPLKGRSRITEFATFLSAFLDHVVDEPAYLLGQSLGGHLATLHALARPADVRGLVLNTSSGFRLTTSANEAERARQAVYESAVSVVRDPSEEAVRAHAARLFHSPDRVPDEIVQLRLRHLRRDATRMALATALEGLLLGDDHEEVALDRGRLEALRVPVCLVWGQQDWAGSIAQARAAVDVIPDSELHEIPNTAHWPHWEGADLFNDIVSNWVGRDLAQTTLI